MSPTAMLKPANPVESGEALAKDQISLPLPPSSMRKTPVWQRLGT
jgi:hypothetical protein